MKRNQKRTRASNATPTPPAKTNFESKKASPETGPSPKSRAIEGDYSKFGFAYIGNSPDGEGLPSAMIRAAHAGKYPALLEHLRAAAKLRKAPQTKPNKSAA